MILNPSQTAHYFRHGVMTLFATLTVVMMLAIPASAQEIIFSPPVQFSDVEEFEFSPDGTRIVMVADLSGGNDQTYVAGVLGNGFANPATLVAPNGVGDNDGSVAWTPDGLSVTARFEPPGSGNEIFLVPADGGQTAQQLTFTGAGNAFEPQVSSDGNRFFYSVGGSLFVTPIAGASASSSIRLNPPNESGESSEMDAGTYSQIGSDIIFSGFASRIPTNLVNGHNDPEKAFYRTAGDGSTANSPTLISIDNFPTSLPFMPDGDAGGDIDFLEVNPNGQSIVFRGDLRVDTQDELFSVPIAGGDFTPLITGELRDTFDLNYFKVSPDGSDIAFVGDYLTDGVAEVFLVPAAGGVPRRVSNTAKFSQANSYDVAFQGGPDKIQFGPDGNSVYYTADGGRGDGGDIEGLDGTLRLFRSLFGDFDNDGDVDLADLDEYNGSLGLAADNDLESLDSDGNGTVDAADLAQHYTDWVETSNGGKGTFAGDANLDGVVDVLSDAAALIDDLGNSVTSWSQGDFNGDGTVDVLGDAALLVENLGKSNVGAAGAATSAVPEPGSLSLLALASVSALVHCRRRR